MVKEISITLPQRRPYQFVRQFKITLLETDPPVWRRIQVPEYYTFYELHVAIQDAMGWLDSHLHDFKIRPLRRACLGIRIESPFALDDLEEEAPLLTTEVAVADFIKEPGDRALYTYDYGDDWQHDVLFEGSHPRERGKKYPTCVAGELAGPPEDCGGIPGYYDCVKALRESDNSEGLLDWLGRWRPDRFDPTRIKFWSPLRRLKLALGE
ncbi:MAG: plasmid pRiA4b ORF-3 family protein [Candidatus Aminicenantes bacterium]|nr:plasmid pRiA4b ORF-3 family protein [Candidatus Aminicenantes bacterium]NLH76022.1 plasmid pRiA4b ORF-3 family protein [Acidobacteriota bacterium]